MIRSIHTYGRMPGSRSGGLMQQVCKQIAQTKKCFSFVASVTTSINKNPRKIVKTFLIFVFTPTPILCYPKIWLINYMLWYSAAFCNFHSGTNPAWITNPHFLHLVVLVFSHVPPALFFSRVLGGLGVNPPYDSVKAVLVAAKQGVDRG